uniref:Uncharacterized protein n=1 Tax=Cyanothece sp. (strain PCC 7425 / ATCC 29141) TaxID=395961 RepID=B8HMW3_CYAP4
MSIRETNKLPASLWEPKLFLRHSTAGRSARSAALLVGSMPSVVTKVQSAGSIFNNCWQVRTVFAKGVFSLGAISYPAPSVSNCTFSFQSATIAFVDDTSIVDQHLAEQAIAWLNERQLDVEQGTFNFDSDHLQLFSEYAIFIGEHYDSVSPLLKDLNLAASGNKSFIHNMENASSTDINHRIDFCRNLHNYQLVLEYNCESLSLIFGTIKDDGKFKGFLNKSWFQLYVCQKLQDLCREMNLDFSYIVDTAIFCDDKTFPSAITFVGGVDLFFLVEDTGFFIQCITEDRSLLSVRDRLHLEEILSIPNSFLYLIYLEMDGLEISTSLLAKGNFRCSDLKHFLSSLRADLLFASRDVVVEKFYFQTATLQVRRSQTSTELLSSSDAYKFVNQEVYNRTGKELSKLQRDIFIYSWNRITYETIARELGYTRSYISGQGLQLWQFLSEITSNHINKNNLVQVIRAWAIAGVPELIISKQQGQGQQFREILSEGAELEMVQIRGGSFEMGSPDDGLEIYNPEGPQHPVTLSPFFISKYPITQSQWQAIAQLPQQNRSLDTDPSYFKGNNRPVEQVSWFDAEEFCHRLSTLTGREYRLPTEAEWEYACRAGTITPFHFGETIATKLANYDGTFVYVNGIQGKYREQTTDVGSFPANAFGLHDMHGNVFEWCLDHWHDNYEGAPTDGNAWLEQESTRNRVLRGGSWDSSLWDCRSAYRYKNLPITWRSNTVGFRVVCIALNALEIQS